MDYKIIVNKDNLDDKKIFTNIKLKSFTNSLNKEFLLEKRTLKAFLDLKKDLEKDNIYIDIITIREDFGEQLIPLSFDIGLIIYNNLIYDKDELFKYEDIFIKIHKMLALYGLILRYPVCKEQITGSNYIPWHYRYVGKKTAKIIMENNLTLEEYNNLYNKTGVLLVNKPKGLTSRDVVNKISSIFDTPKVGHNGTLDPLAEGLLVITINKATKINELLTCNDKEYIAEVKVGIETDTLDLEGKIVKKSKKRVTKEELDTLVQKFTCKYLQTIPMYSAIKVNGKKLYEYARNNEEVTLPKREVLIKELELLDYNKDYFKFRCVVTKGTYIRSLIKDMGDFLGIPFTMSSLIRTRQGKFNIDDSVSLDEVSINNKLITISDALDMPKCELNPKDYKYVLNGAVIDNSYNIKDMVLFIKNGKEVAIYKKENSKLKCFKML